MTVVEVETGCLDDEVDELLLLVDDDATSVAPSPPVVDSSCLLVRMM